MRGLSIFRVLLLLASLHWCFAVDSYDITWVPVTGISDGESHVSSKVVASISNLIWIIMNPGFWTAMAIGALISVFGVIRSQKEYFITGFALFLFAIMLRAIMQIVIVF